MLKICLLVCLFVLEFYGPVNNEVMPSRSFNSGTVPGQAYGVYISQLIGFARVSSHVADFKARNKSLTAKRLQQGYWYHKLLKTFSKFYRRHYELVPKFNAGLKPLLHQGLLEPEFYGDLVNKLLKKKKKWRSGWFIWSVQKHYRTLQTYWI